MNETQKRIAAYQAALPGLKERVMAVLLLLVMSASMLTSASFAWLTLSRAPEISNVSTTVTANGNLEIALVEPNGAEPGVSKVGDSSAAENQSVVKSNLTWGNLVNLSDPSYGLNNLVLRPALLGNANNLLEQPLKGVDYGQDGRVEMYYNEDYQFSNWTVNSEGIGMFKYNAVPQYGVRAISTIKYTYVNNRYFEYSKIKNKATGIRDNVINGYSEVTNNKAYIDSLAGLIGQFMTDNLNDYDTDVSSYVTDMYHMLLDIYTLMSDSTREGGCFEDAMAEVANAQLYLSIAQKMAEETDDTAKIMEAYNAKRYTKEKLLSATSAQLSADKITLVSLSQYKTLKSNIEKILYGTDPETADCLYDYYRIVHPNLIEGTDQVDEAYDSGAAVLRSSLMSCVASMVDIGTTKIIHNGTSKTVNQITASKSEALNMLGAEVDAVIAKGYLKDFEQLTGGRLNAKNVTVKAKYIMTAEVKAKTITTAATQPYEIDKDVNYTEELAQADKGDYTGVAQDTYGMALDFWVRTNSPDSYLILEGNVLTETSRIRATGIDRNGQVVDLWTVSISTEAADDNDEMITMSEDYAVYPITEEDADGNEKTVWYYASNHSRLYNDDGTAPEGQTIGEPIERYEEIENVVGYEGENRVWDTEENIFLNVDSTTQGSGSCYVFYADDPTQQENSLRLLSNLRAAFVDCNEASATYGKMVALAHLNTEHRYEENGKVTVPLELMDDSSTYLTKTETGGLAVMPLDQNVATRLTAIVFLDGREISNADVLAANDIQGRLNIQFGSSEKLTAVSDENLESQFRSISAVIKSYKTDSFPTSNNAPTDKADVTFSFDEATDDNPMRVDVKVTVTGDAPNRMEAFFMRKVNDTQGARELSFFLEPSTTEPGVFVGNHTFTAPGEYVLRTVQLDGVDYDLPANNYPRVSISGFGIERVAMKHNGTVVTAKSLRVLSGDRSVSSDLEVKLASSGKMPNSVRMQFVKDDGTQIGANMYYNATDATWYGKANFATSGEYTLRYIVMDGQYTELAEEHQKTLDISMGITVYVIDGSVNGESMRNTTWEGEPFTVPMFVEIYDDSGEKLRNLNGVKLVYARGGSEINEASPDLVWDVYDDRYEGNIQIPGAGVYTFRRVEVNGDALTNQKNTPPTFTCISPEPPVYYDAEPMEGMDYMLSTGKNPLQIGVRISNAAGATVTPFINGELMSTGVEASTNVGDVSTFIFDLPTDNNGYQSGDWTITGLQLTNVYTGEGDNVVFHDDENPLVWTLGKGAGNTVQTDDDLHVKVVNVVVTLQNDTKDGKPAVTDELELGGGAFMSTASATKPITIKITDQNGDALDADYVTVAVPKITYQYAAKSSKTYGGYLAASENVASIQLTGTTTDGKTYTMPAPTFVYAGQYVATSMTFGVTSDLTSQNFEFVSEESYKVTDPKPILDMPVYIMNTVTPSASFTSGTPSGSNNTQITWTLSSGKPNFSATVLQTSSVTAYAATLYAVPTVDNDTQAHGSFTLPTLAMRTDDVPDGYTASVTFAANGNAGEITYSRSGSGTINAKSLGSKSQIKKWTTKWMYFVSLTHTLDAYYGLGNQTIETMTLTKNNVTYTVYLENPLVLNNPNSVNKTS